MPASKIWWGLIGLLVLLSVSAVSAHEELEEAQQQISHPSDHQLGNKHVWPVSLIIFDHKYNSLLGMHVCLYSIL